MISYQDEAGNPISQTYLKTINNQLSAIMNYAMTHYRQSANSCQTADSMEKSLPEEMNIWTQAQYKPFSADIQKPSVKPAVDMLFYIRM